MLEIDLRLCSVQGIGGRRCLRCVPLATYSSKFPKRDAYDVINYLYASKQCRTKILPSEEFIDQVLENFLAFGCACYSVYSELS
jgi:hypothetical protein